MEEAGWQEEMFSPLEPLNLWQGTPSEETTDGVSVGRGEGAAGLMELGAQAGTGQPAWGGGAPAAGQHLQQEVADLKAQLEIAELKQKLQAAQAATQATPPPPASPTTTNTPPVSMAPAESVAMDVQVPAVAGGGGAGGVQASSHQIPLLAQDGIGHSAQVLYTPSQPWQLPAQMAPPYPNQPWGTMPWGLPSQPQAPQPTITMTWQEAQMLRAAMGGSQGSAQLNLSFADFCNGFMPPFGRGGR